MPVGWFNLADHWNRDFRAYPALGASAFADYAINRFLKIGASPSLALNVIPNRSDTAVGNMAAGELRLVLQAPMWRRLAPYLVLAGGYSAIFLSPETAHGFLADAAIGLRLRLRRHALLAEIGYMHGFQNRERGAYCRALFFYR